MVRQRSCGGGWARGAPASAAPQLMRDSLGRQPAMKALAGLVILFACTSSGSALAGSRLSPRRCPVSTTGDSTGSIRVIVDPPEAYSAWLSISLYRIRPGMPDTLVMHPPLGVDTLAGLPAGQYRLWIRQIGYHPPDRTLRVGHGEAWCVTAYMVRDTTRVEAVNP